MAKVTYDWTWTVADSAANVFVELEVRVTGTFNQPFIAGVTPITIEEAVARFTKHDKVQLCHIPDDLRIMCIRDLQVDDELMRKMGEFIEHEDAATGSYL